MIRRKIERDLEKFYADGGCSALLIDGARQVGGLTADIRLPPSEKAGGKPLVETLAARKSARAFADREVEPQILSSLLWAADGISRPDGRRTAPNPQRFGYAVFGRVTNGMDVVDKIAQVKTGNVGYFGEVPVEPVVIKSAKIAE